MASVWLEKKGADPRKVIGHLSIQEAIARARKLVGKKYGTATGDYWVATAPNQLEYLVYDSKKGVMTGEGGALALIYVEVLSPPSDPVEARK